MSQPLPAHPDLEHLRKQAKALLRDLRTRDAEAKLADALHLVARQYGFPSWPKLKAHVKSIVQSERAPDPGKPFTGRWILRTLLGLFDTRLISFSELSWTSP